MKQAVEEYARTRVPPETSSEQADKFVQYLVSVHLDPVHPLYTPQLEVETTRSFVRWVNEDEFRAAEHATISTSECSSDLATRWAALTTDEQKEICGTCPISAAGSGCLWGQSSRYFQALFSVLAKYGNFALLSEVRFLEEQSAIAVDELSSLGKELAQAEEIVANVKIAGMRIFDRDSNMLGDETYFGNGFYGALQAGYRIGLCHSDAFIQLTLTPPALFNNLVCSLDPRERAQLGLSDFCGYALVHIPQLATNNPDMIPQDASLPFKAIFVKNDRFFGTSLDGKDILIPTIQSPYSQAEIWTPFSNFIYPGKVGRVEYISVSAREGFEEPIRTPKRFQELATKYQMPIEIG